MNQQQKNFLLTLARTAISDIVTTGEKLKANLKEIDEEMLQTRSTFVTLTIEDALRGCIGHLTAFQPLYQDVIDNAIAAATKDERFFPVDEKELPTISIEISILSHPQPLPYTSAKDLLDKLQPDVHGVILSKGVIHQATFLPQVWEDLQDKELFLSQLCRKAGLETDAWKHEELKVEVYEVERFGEE
ncbi:MAG: AmmeMemoRadiSam system protein A [bacterium]